MEGDEGGRRRTTIDRGAVGAAATPQPTPGSTPANPTPTGPPTASAKPYTASSPPPNTPDQPLISALGTPVGSLSWTRDRYDDQPENEAANLPRPGQRQGFLLVVAVLTAFAAVRAA